MCEKFIFGNDTIDCYPSLERRIKKILILNEQKFKELEKEFGLFFQGPEIDSVNDRRFQRQLEGQFQGLKSLQQPLT